MEALIANRYRIENILGAGGMGVVYRAYDRLTGQTIALKRVPILTANLDFRSHTPMNTEQIANKRLGLALEFRTLAGLRHPHINSVMDYGFDADKQPFFTMNLVENAQSLTDYACNLPREQQVQLLMNVLQAIAYLHRYGIIHRDLKSQNVLVGQDGSLKVMDFGLESDHSVPSNKGGQAGGGTIAYMAPELLMNAPATVQSDLYAVGVMIYELLAGHRPFIHQDLATLLLQITSDEPDTSMFDEQLQTVILRLMAKQADDRYHNAEQVMAALSAATGSALPQEDIAIRESYLQAARFVGRHGELQQLQTALDDMLNEKGSIWLVGGESGVGKSRLVDELHAQALVAGTLVLRGQGVANGGLPFQLWRQPARSLILATRLDDLQASILKDIVPDISDLLGREIPDAIELQGEAYLQRLTQTLFELLRQVNIPLLLILEDLQWASESLLLVRAMLQEQLPNLLVVGTYRNDERPNLPDELPGIQIIRLPRLNRDMLAELSVSILGDLGRQPTILRLLEQETEGNSYFIVEVLRALAEDAGRLSKIGTVTLSQGIFTGGMRNILQRRLGQIPIAYQSLLKLAAVAGRQIDIPLLENAMSGSDVEGWLYLSHNAAVLQVSENQWQFTHDKLREAVLLDLENDEHQALHQQVAEAVERLHPNDTAYHEILMKHWHDANQWDKEIYYLLQVVKHKALVTAEYEQANQLAQRALERLNADDTRRMTLLILQTLSYLRLTELEQAENIAQQARALAQAMHNDNGLALSLHYLGVIAFYHADHPVAQAYFEESIAIRRTDGKLHRATPSLNNLGAIAVRQGAYAEARAYFQESLEISQTINNIDETAWCLFFLGWLSRYQRMFDDALTYSQQSLKIRQARSDLFGVAWSLRELGDLALVQGNYQEAHTYIQQGLHTSRAIGDKWGIAGCLIILGTVEAKQKNLEDAQNTFQQSLQLSQMLGDKFCIACTLCGLAFVQLETRDNAARDTLGKALLIAHQLHTVPVILEIIVGYAHLLLQQGHAVRAGEWISLTQNHPAYNPTTAFRLADILPQLKAALDVETFQAAKTHGAQLDLETVVTEILDMWS